MSEKVPRNFTLEAVNPGGHSSVPEKDNAIYELVPVVPVMSTGATDGSRLRNAEIPIYGVSGIFVEFGENRMHGRDERLAVKSFEEATEFLYRLVRALGSGE